MKKALCFLFSILLLMTCIPMAYAENEATISVDAVSCNAGDTVTVPVQIAGNPGLIAMRLYVQYDATKLQLVSAEDMGLLGTGNDYFSNDISENPYTLLWEDALTKADYANNGILVQLKFSVLENAALGATEISLTLDKGSTFNVDLTNVSFKLKNGAIQINEKPKPIIKLHNYTPSNTVDYRTTVTFSTDQIKNSVSGAEIHWFIDGKDSGVSENFTVKEAKKDFTVQAKYMKDGKVLAKTEVETVKVNSGFFARLRAFFQGLFRKLPVVVQ